MARRVVDFLLAEDNEDDVVLIRKPVDFDRFREVIEHFALYWTLVAEAPPVDV